jgi:hypothetical protein
VRILLVLNTPGFLRYFDVTVRRLLERGHEVVLAFTRPDLRPDSLDVLADWPVRPEIAPGPPERVDGFARQARGVRQAVDFVRYLDPRFADAEYLRNRRRIGAFTYAPWTRMLGGRHSLPRPLVSRLSRALLACEGALPSARNVEEYVRAARPDLVLVSPLVNGGSPQTDYVKSARALGIPTGALIASWDNLTNKGLVKELPDAVVVWNDVQRQEAIELHGVPAERVVVTGAQPFDRWFGRVPSTSRDDFLAHAGLRPDRPYAMFVGSTGNISREGVEESFVAEWVRSLRESSNPALSDLGVLVRPHPDRPGSWESLDLDGVSNAVLWPPRRPNTVLPSARSEYFDSLYHSAAVVGVNTSAMVEAAIVGRPVLTIRSSAFREAQEGTVHFRYLLVENDGFLLVADDVSAHLPQLAACIADPGYGAAERERFVASFIRPRGADFSANDLLVEAIETLGRSEPLPRAAQRGATAIRLALRLGRPLLGASDGQVEEERLRARLTRRTERLRASTAPSASAVAALHERYARYRLALVHRRWKRRGRRVKELREEKRRLLTAGSQDND